MTRQQKLISDYATAIIKLSKSEKEEMTPQAKQIANHILQLDAERKGIFNADDLDSLTNKLREVA